MISRQLTIKLKQVIRQFQVVAVMGPRQSGKTTLVKHTFPDWPYVSLEDPEMRDFAREDPRGFLNSYKSGAILDEVQRVPDLFSYIQTSVDKSGTPGQFILTGSHNFLLHEKISQSLAGRVYLLKLLPLSITELEQSAYRFDSFAAYIFHGFYPRIYDIGVSPTDWYPNYVQTYVERDVRLVRNISDVHTFHRFLRMCAARAGQLVNLVSLANDCGITHNTAKSWLSILEASFIVFFLQPHYQNFNKRLVKSAKLYFYDPGLVCSLLAIQNESQLDFHPMKGSLFETMLISEIMKHYFNQGLTPNCYFWRDKAGHEIDCLLETADRLIPVEFKSGQTVMPDYFKNLNYWRKLSGQDAEHAYVIYGGDEMQTRSSGQVLGWRHIQRVLEQTDG